MTTFARSWLTVAGSAVCVVGLVGMSGAAAGAEPAPTPAPGPATVTQTVTVAPVAAPSPVAAPPPVAPALVPAASGTLANYFTSHRVTLSAQRAQDFKALGITLPMPQGWTTVPDPNVPDAFAVIADRVGGDGLYTSNAQLVVYKLGGEFDPREAITHGPLDSQLLRGWRTTNASLADFCGFPSSLTAGTYRENEISLNTSRRHVIVTAGPEKYLVSLSVTTALNQVVPTAGATDAIINGFRVSPAQAVGAPQPPTQSPTP